MPNIISVIFAVIALIVIVMFLNMFPIGLWITAMFSGVNVSIMTLIGMRFRRVRP